MTAGRRGLEIELKYRPRTLTAGERILALDELAGLRATAPAVAVAFEDRYVDTPDGAIARAGFAARIRTTPDGTIVSVKSTGASAVDGATHRRDELEGPADATHPARDWPASEARDLVWRLSGDADLTELVTIRQLRRRRLLRDDGTTIELSLDDVEVVGGGRVVDRWLELEAELVDGDAGRLRDVAAALAREPDLVPGELSKLDAALGALRARDPGSAATPVERSPSSPPLARTPGVLGDDHVAEAGRKILRFHFARMVAREVGTRSGDAGDLKAMRVATRRMRAGWRIFGSGFRDGRTKRLRRRLRDVAGRLGAVRDLDVLLEGLDQYRGSAPDESAPVEPLAAAWRQYRADARDLLLRELDSDAYRRFVEDFRVFVQSEGLAAREFGPTEPHHVRDTAPSRIWAAYEQVRGYEPVVRAADVETLHELRIAAKWLRYSLEFVREPLGGDAEVLIAAVTDLQDHLGWMHDADVAASMARAHLVEHASSLSGVEAAAIGRYLVSREREVERLRRTVPRPWRPLASPAYRRRLGRAVANL